MLTCRVASRLTALKNGGHAVAFSARDGVLAYAGGDPMSGSRCVREAVCWRMPDQLLWSHEERGRRVNALAFSPDSQRLLCAEEGPHVTELDEKITHLKCLRDSLKHLADCCHGDHRPDCPILDDIAELAVASR